MLVCINPGFVFIRKRKILYTVFIFQDRIQPNRWICINVLVESPFVQ